MLEICFAAQLMTLSQPNALRDSTARTAVAPQIYISNKSQRHGNIFLLIIWCAVFFSNRRVFNHPWLLPAKLSACTTSMCFFPLLITKTLFHAHVVLGGTCCSERLRSIFIYSCFFPLLSFWMHYCRVTALHDCFPTIYLHSWGLHDLFFYV